MRQLSLGQLGCFLKSVYWFQGWVQCVKFYEAAHL